MSNGPIDWGKVLAPNARAKHFSRHHPCHVKGCERKTTGKYCANHKAMLNEQTRVPDGTPSLRQLREANQARLRQERES